MRAFSRLRRVGIRVIIFYLVLILVKEIIGFAQKSGACNASLLIQAPTTTWSNKKQFIIDAVLANHTPHSMVVGSTSDALPEFTLHFKNQDGIELLSYTLGGDSFGPPPIEVSSGQTLTDRIDLNWFSDLHLPSGTYSLSISRTLNYSWGIGAGLIDELSWHDKCPLQSNSVAISVE